VSTAEDETQLTVDLEVDFHNEDATGFVWQWLREARDPSVVVPNAIVIIGDNDARAMARVVDHVSTDTGVYVHLQVLPGLVEDYQQAIQRASTLAGGRHDTRHGVRRESSHNLNAAAQVMEASPMYDRTPMEPDVVGVSALAGRTIWLEYADGQAGEVDLTELLRGPFYARVRTEDALFAQVFVNEVGTIAWPDGADLAPEALYELAAPHLRQPVVVEAEVPPGTRQDGYLNVHEVQLEGDENLAKGTHINIRDEGGEDLPAIVDDVTRDVHGPVYRVKLGS